jgi:mRNA-degrading endonuclease RelE of RelBE toxin-antitoxin system
MVIVETSVFTRQIRQMLSEEEYRRFQLRLVEDPAVGDIYPGTGGLRKVRVAAKGHGKRGGARVIYYWAVKKQQILLLYVFAKGERADLTPAQRRILQTIVEAEYK